MSAGSRIKSGTAQRVVVDQVLVAERDPEDALAQQIGHRVRDGVGDAKIAEARGQPLDEPDRPVGRPEQDRAAIRGDRAAVEGAHKFAPAGASEIQLILATLCRHRRAPPRQLKSLRHNNFHRVGAPMLLTSGEKFRLILPHGS